MSKAGLLMSDDHDAAERWRLLQAERLLAEAGFVEDPSTGKWSLPSNEIRNFNDVRREDAKRLVDLAAELTVDPWQWFSVSDLRAWAHEHDLIVPSRLRRDEIITALETAEIDPPPRPGLTFRQ